MRGYRDYSHGDFQGVYFYSINVTRKPFDNVWVRRAFDYAVDREAIANDLLKRSRDPWGSATDSGDSPTPSSGPRTNDRPSGNGQARANGHNGGRSQAGIDIGILVQYFADGRDLLIH